jgi:uncharacterized membrane protein
VSELIVFGFQTETGASEMREALAHLQKQQLITLDDAAVVVRRQDGKVRVKQAVDLVGEGALGGAFWGMLIGLLFFMPWMGLAIGAISGALAGKVSDIGIDDDFIKEVGAAIEPGNSALFLLVRDVTPDKVLDELTQFDAKVLRTSLSTEKEARLRAAFGVGPG